MSRTAVILFNLGGPDRPEAIRPFLFNLFNDPAIIGLPGFLRSYLAGVIATRREREAKHIYGQIGGRSPILEETWAQAHALEAALGEGYRVLPSMRYWHPMSDEVAGQVVAYAPDRVVLIPLYPQYSTTTTASSFRDWMRAYLKYGIAAPLAAVCCYPSEPRFVAAHVEGIRAALARTDSGRTRVLFSAHGLPEKTVTRGDPYQWQVERTTAAVVKALEIDGLDYAICYQSRVGPLRWIGPATVAEIQRAGRDGRDVVLVPIAFVSEHSETLVELDITCAALAKEVGVSTYVRVPALGTSANFIAALANLVREASSREAITSDGGGRICPWTCGRCGYEERLL
jgi:protoporphyrin/coproporphyrin ferrochelatase